MTDASQILIPQSFIALDPGPNRSKPSAMRERISQHDAFCEDLERLLNWPVTLATRDP